MQPSDTQGRQSARNAWSLAFPAATHRSSVNPFFAECRYERQVENWPSDTFPKKPGVPALESSNGMILPADQKGLHINVKKQDAVSKWYCEHPWCCARHSFSAHPCQEASRAGS